MQVNEDGCAPPDATNGGDATAQPNSANHSRRRRELPIAVAEPLPAGVGNRRRPIVVVRECPFDCGTPHIHFGPPDGTRGAGCFRNRRYRLVPVPETDAA